MTQKFDTIKELAPEDLDIKILEILQVHVGRDNAISRRTLIESVFGVYLMPDENISNLVMDRQIRWSLARLQEGYPILSNSGDGGYYLPGDMAEVNEYAAEINSRAMKLLHKSRKVVKAAREMFQIPPQLELPI